MKPKMWKVLLLMGLGFLLCSALLFSSEKKEKKWNLSSELSYITSTGNNELATANLQSLYQQKWVKTSFHLDGSFLFSTQENTTTAEQYHLGEKVEYKIEKKIYLFEYGEWLKNNFAGINNQYKLQAGGGYWFIDTSADKFRGELGAGYTMEEDNNSLESEYGSYRVYGEYQHHFSSTASFSSQAEFSGNLEDDRDYQVNSITGLTTVLSSNLSSKIAYTLKYDHQPVTGFKKTDTILTAALILKL
ncbi:DUF481 domain-containing protein [bacterium]|nr:DUF481 domain-containing protein [bacterium]